MRAKQAFAVHETAFVRSATQARPLRDSGNYNKTSSAKLSWKAGVTSRRERGLTL